MTTNPIELAKGVGERFSKVRTDAITEMFDNKYADGIYPTSKFFETIDNSVVSELCALLQSCKEAIEGMKQVDEHGNATSTNSLHYNCGLVAAANLLQDVIDNVK